jgi:4-hydroxy-3-methylbut-2-enyl diphosphate reductase
VRHEVVHNKFVVEDLRNRGAIFVEELDQVPDDVIVIFSAHGVSQAVRQEAAGRGLKVFDATCPLVTKVHIEVAKYSRDGRECILIGHAGHPEVEGTMGQYDASNGGAIYLVEDEKTSPSCRCATPSTWPSSPRPPCRWMTPAASSTPCAHASRASVGRARTTSATPPKTARTPSSNWPTSATWCWWSAAPTAPTPTACVSWPSAWAPAYLIDGAEDLQRGWFDGARIGITAGASAPKCWCVA